MFPLLRGPFGRSLRAAELRILDFLLRLLFVYECHGQQNVPMTGPAVIASNHPSYLDSILLSVRLRRPIRFMAWEALFKVPVLGWIIRSFGAFPVDSSPGKGREAYERAKALLKAGKVVGMFPEGHRSSNPDLEPTVRAGAARLVLETGAPLVPATITGAYRAWPQFRSLPRPAHIRVRFHAPIDPRPYQGLPEDEAIAAVLAEWRRRVDRSLKPGVKADARLSRIYNRPAPWPRLHELALVVAAVAVLGVRHAPVWYMLGPAVYAAYLLADGVLLPQRRRFKWMRNILPLVFILAFGPVVFRALGVPHIPAGRALDAVIVGAMLPYFYERALIAIGWARGLVLASLLELVALWLAPSGLGPHVALPLYAAGYASLHRTVLWKYATPLLGLYGLGAAWYMGGGSELALHVAAGTVACALTLIWPYHHGPRRTAGGAPPAAGLAPPSGAAGIGNRAHGRHE
jgi:1-acyl-sn-glycerol-3-phosphate acyltransferase